MPKYACSGPLRAVVGIALFAWVHACGDDDPSGSDGSVAPNSHDAGDPSDAARAAGGAAHRPRDGGGGAGATDARPTGADARAGAEGGAIDGGLIAGDAGENDADSGEEPPTSVRVGYQVRCLDCMPHAPDGPVRMIDARDGDEGLTVYCRVESHRGAQLASFEVSYTDAQQPANSFSLSVVQAELDSSGDPGSTCRVSVTEGNDTYEGPCTRSTPSAEGPCQLVVEIAGDTLTGSLLCRRMPNRATAQFWRHVVAPATEAPAAFEVRGCTLPESGDAGSWF